MKNYTKQSTIKTYFWNGSKKVQTTQKHGSRCERGEGGGKRGWSVVGVRGRLDGTRRVCFLFFCGWSSLPASGTDPLGFICMDDSHLDPSETHNIMNMIQIQYLQALELQPSTGYWFSAAYWKITRYFGGAWSATKRNWPATAFSWLTSTCTMDRTHAGSQLDMSASAGPRRKVRRWTTARRWTNETTHSKQDLKSLILCTPRLTHLSIDRLSVSRHSQSTPNVIFSMTRTKNKMSWWVFRVQSSLFQMTRV